ncbi:MAG: hypothetical protein KC620_02620 [Myxococcales bacterium]|nr:hypothetical protein [Myxococcales bacterium]
MKRAPLALLLTGAAASAQAAPNVRLTDSLTIERRVDNQNGDDGDDNYGVAINRLNLVGSDGGLSANARVDTIYFVNPPATQASEGEYADDARLERLSVRYRLGDWQIQVGDFYRQLGRGIVLSLRKVDEVGLDLTVQGGEVAWDTKDHAAALFAGRVNAVNLDAVSQKFVDDPDDVLVGAEYTLRALGPLRLNVYGLYMGIEEPILASVSDDDHVFSGGLSAEIPDLFSFGSAYFEVDYQRRELVGETFPGKAAYGAVELFFGDYGLVAEGLYLDDFELRGSSNSALQNRFVYGQPPTLERLDQEVLNNKDVLGGRLRVDRYLLEGDLALYINGMYRITDQGESSQVDQLHGYAGFDLTYGEGASRLGLSAGYRDEKQPELSDPDLKSMIHFEGDWLQAISGGWSLHLSSTNELRTLKDDDYARGSTLLGVEAAGLGALTVELGYDTQKEGDNIRQFFYATVLDWEAAEWMRARFTAGHQRGGLKCIGGVCRIFPEFAGARLDIITTLDL